MLSSAYSVSSFNAMLSLRAADEVFSRSKRDQLPLMGELIRRYGLEQHVGIQLLHTHFKLRDGEKLVEAQTSRTSEKITVGQVCAQDNARDLGARICVVTDYASHNWMVYLSCLFVPCASVRLCRSVGPRPVLRLPSFLACGLWWMARGRQWSSLPLERWSRVRPTWCSC
jgi:hypothetical protein